MERPLFNCEKAICGGEVTITSSISQISFGDGLFAQQVMAPAAAKLAFIDGSTAVALNAWGDSARGVSRLPDGL